MTRARITLSGIEAAGRHGANPGEQLVPQGFVVDLLVDADVDTTADVIGATIDYRAIVEVVRSVVGGASFDLIESLADAVARAVFELPRVDGVVATVHKPAAARSLETDDVAATVEVR